MRERPALPIARVIEQFDVSRSTLRRSIEAQKLPNARKDETGRWAIPVDDLVNAGFKARKTWLNELAHEPGHEPGKGVHTPSDPSSSQVATELAHLADELAHERAHVSELSMQLDTSERLREAAERNATDLRTALKMLEAPTPNRDSRPEERKHWWQRNSPNYEG